jgi:osmotically-inducible protein OsmY
MMKTKHLSALSLVAAIGVLTPLLQGCFPVVAAGAAAGVIAITDRRSFATQALDEEIELKAENRLREKIGDKAHISVVSYNRKVLLLGEATTAALRAEAVDIVRGVPNVEGMTDDLVVGGISSLTARSNDAYITSKVKARFIEANKFSANHVKVVTESGSVYLLGLVTQREAKDAIEVTRTTAGVRKVINMLETISEAAARDLDNRKDQPDAAAKPAAPAKR